MNQQIEDAYKNLPKRKICIPVAGNILIAMRPFSKKTTLRPKQLKHRDSESELSLRDVNFLLSIQAACFENIFPSLRLVSLSWDEKYTNLYFYVDGELSQDDREAISLSETSFISDLPNPLSCQSEIKRVDFPNPIDFLGECVYARKETPVLAASPVKVMKEQCTSWKVKVKIILLRSIIGFVFPQLRMIDVISEKSSVELIFYVDGMLSEDDQKCLDEICRRAQAQFPKNELLHWHTKTIQLDFPEMPIERQGSCVYWRKEFSSM